MATTVLEAAMGAKKPPKGESVRLDSDVMRMARLIAAYEDAGTIGDVISEVSRPGLIEKMKRYKLPIAAPEKDKNQS